MPDIVSTGVPDKKVEAPIVTTPEDKQEEVELTPTEQRAVEQGWKPLSDWEGEPDEHRSAREFLDRGELLSTIKNTKSQLREITQVVANLTEHNKRVYIAGYDKALKDLRLQRAQAMEDRNPQAVAQMDELIDKTKDHIAAARATPTAQPTAQETATFVQFKEDNGWYNASPKMKKWAHGEAIEYVQDHPADANNEAAVYAHLAKEVKKEFPEYFQSRSRLPASPDGDGTRSSGGPGAKGGSTAFAKLMATLPEDQQKVAKDFVKRGIMTQDAYVEQYDSMRRS